MRVYWDSSALVVATMDPNVRQHLLKPDQFCRPHALAEVFSTLTGGRLGFRLNATDAAAVIAQLGDSLQFVESEVLEIVSALNSARNLGARGGRVHDFLHAVAASEATLNTPDFQGLFASGKLEESKD
jgi:hypothetical protein